MRFQGSIISSEEENKSMVPVSPAGVVPHLVSITRSLTYKQDTHTSCTGEKGRACIPMHTSIHTDVSSGSQKCRGILSGRPSGAPCRLGYKEAGWQSRAWRHLQTMSHGRLAGPWAGPGRVVGIVSGRVLLPSLAGGAWAGSPGMMAQGSWAAHLEAEGKGRAPRWWKWWWSRPGVVGGTSCTDSSRSK